MRVRRWPPDCIHNKGSVANLRHRRKARSQDNTRNVHVGACRRRYQPLEKVDGGINALFIVTHGILHCALALSQLYSLFLTGPVERRARKSARDALEISPSRSTGMAKRWLHNGCSNTVEAMSDHTSSVFRGGIARRRDIAPSRPSPASIWQCIQWSPRYDAQNGCAT